MNGVLYFDWYTPCFIKVFFLMSIFTVGIGSLLILDVARCYLFTLYINIKIGKNSC